jgi:hypothetical protein
MTEQKKEGGREGRQEVEESREGDLEECHHLGCYAVWLL